MLDGPRAAVSETESGGRTTDDDEAADGAAVRDDDERENDEATDEGEKDGGAVVYERIRSEKDIAAGLSRCASTGPWWAKARRKREQVERRQEPSRPLTRVQATTSPWVVIVTFAKGRAA